MENLRTRRLLVIGGTGFIGSHVVNWGCRLGWEVVSVSVNKKSAVGFRKNTGANYLISDLTIKEPLKNLNNKKFDYVVNLGGYINHTLFFDGGRSAIREHFDGLLNLIESVDCRHLRRFVQIGSSDEYGQGIYPQSEGQREQAISPYSLGKIAATHFLQMLHRSEGFPAVILRLFLTYGPGQNENRFLPQVIRACLNNDEFPVSAGEQLRDFCFVDDTVRAIFNCFECEDANGRIINIGSGLPITVGEVIKKTVDIIGSGRPTFGAIPYRVGENMSLYPNLDISRDVLGWTPQVSLEEGIIKTIEWYRKCQK